MANQRPINRRPWRKAPWSRSAARPKRWNAAFEGHSVGELTERILADAGVVPNVGPIATLVSGQVDVEPWADAQEVLLDRTIGRIHLYSSTASDGHSYAPYVRLGLIVQEEVEAAGAGGVDEVKLALAEQEVWEDYEWMWMWSGPLDFVWGTSTNLHWGKTIEFDIGNRRKIGQSDELNLYGQSFRYPAMDAAAVGLIMDVRTMLVSK